jgi:hypothetical protein
MLLLEEREIDGACQTVSWMEMKIFRERGEFFVNVVHENAEAVVATPRKAEGTYNAMECLAPEEEYEVWMKRREKIGSCRLGQSVSV